MKLLLHICCAPCAAYPWQWFSERKFQVRGLFFNPNIHPYQEYQRRMQSLLDFQKQSGLPLICRDEYGLQEFVRQTAFREQERCRLCYHWRLQVSAVVARRGKFDAFSTTLLYSKFQKHKLIREIAESLARQEGIPFYYQDFRKGWKEGIALSRRMGLYRQQYCGCIYSEQERYAPRRTKLVREFPA